MNALLDGINRTADAWWSYMLPAAWQAALVGLLLLAVVAIGRRWPSPIRFAILALALLEVRHSPAGGGSQRRLQPIRRRNLHRHADAVAVAPIAPPADPPQQWQQPIAPVMAGVRDRRVPDFRPNEHPITAASSVPPESPSEVAAAPVASAEPPCPALGLKAYLMFMHLAGVLAMFCLIAVQYRRVLRVTRTAEPVLDGPLHGQFVSLCRDLGLRRKPRLLLAAAGQQPFSFGTVRAAVVLPKPLIHRLSVEQLRATLAHELAHHRRGDLWLNWLQVLLCAIWWFHPVLWLLNRAMRPCARIAATTCCWLTPWSAATPIAARCCKSPRLPCDRKDRR